MQISLVLAAQVTSWTVDAEGKTASGQGIFPVKGRDGAEVFAPIDLGGYGQICQKIEEGLTYVLEGTLEPVGKEMRFVVKSAAPTCDPCPVLSSISLTGGLGADPETKYFDNSEVTNCRIACRTVKEDSPLWIDLKFWGNNDRKTNISQIASQYLKKGSRVSITGRLTAESWTDKTSGEIRNKILVNVEQLELPPREKKQPQPDEDF